MSDNGENRRLWVLIGGAFLVIAVLTAGIMAVTRSTGDKKTDAVKVNVPISAEDQNTIKSDTDAFLQASGNFGVRSDNLNADNILNVRYLSDQSSAEDVSTFITTRETSYKNARQYIDKDANIYYDSNITGEWSNAFETSQMSTFEIVNSNIQVADKGTYLTIDGKQRLAASVEATFTSRQTIRSQTKDDPSWDGTFNILSKDFNNNLVQMTFIQEDGGWKIYGMNPPERQFLLSTWKSPSQDAYGTQEQGFISTGKTIKAQLPKVPTTEKKNG